MTTLESPKYLFDSSNFHFSGPIAVSLANAEKIKTQLLSAIEELDPLLAKPDEEELYCINLDFFRM